IEELNSDLDKTRKENSENAAKLFEAMVSVGKVETLESTKSFLETKVTQLEQSNQSQQTLISELNERKAVLDVKQENLEKEAIKLQEEKDNLLQTYRAEFENMTSKILTSQTNMFMESNKSEISNIVEPLNSSLAEFKKKIEEYKEAQTGEKIALDQKLNAMFKAKDSLENVTHGLVNVLRGETKVRGFLGEDTLRMLLENSGFQKDVNYFEQYSDETGKHSGFIMLLPSDKMIVIETKTLFNNYEKYVHETDINRKNDFLDAHIADMKKAIAESGASNYQERANKLSKDLEIFEYTDTVEYVLMWVNPESAITAAVNADPEILEQAHEKKVILASSTSLINALKMIDSMWVNYITQEKGEEIKELADNLIGGIESFLRNFAEIKYHLKKALLAQETVADIVGDSENKGMLMQARELADIYETKILNKDNKKGLSGRKTPYALKKANEKRVIRQKALPLKEVSEGVFEKEVAHEREFVAEQAPEVYERVYEKTTTQEREVVVDRVHEISENVSEHITAQNKESVAESASELLPHAPEKEVVQTSKADLEKAYKEACAAEFNRKGVARPTINRVPENRMPEGTNFAGFKID
ncbi:MAG: DNA recombination protein RmuC, partial [Elusimicrobia bacterium]|nr:DNA recombination protein RmuC [Elusimicrobiota bacterium]